MHLDIKYLNLLFQDHLLHVRELFQKLDLLDLLETGDSVMADCGFTTADLLDAKGVILSTPPMTIYDQLTHRKILTTRRIAALRIHIEHAIGRI